MDALVPTAWLAERLAEPDLVVIDSSWHMPASGRSGREDYFERHIPGARFLDIDELSDRSSPAPHMLPTAEEFGRAMERMGIGREDRIVVYDNSPNHTAARGWFMFRHFGATKVAILDGGFQKWLSEGRPVEASKPQPRMARFEALENRTDVVSKEQLLRSMDAPLLDARSKGRFEGRERDPRPGVAAGHIPGTRNLPFGLVYNDDGTMKGLEEIRRLFEQAGIDPSRPFVASCGSGVTANSLIFAAHLLGNDRAKLYDGSWAEWGADPLSPKALGPA